MPIKPATARVITRPMHVAIKDIAYQRRHLVGGLTARALLDRGLAYRDRAGTLRLTEEGYNHLENQ